MAISAERRQSAIKSNQTHAKDTGSSEVQIAVLTEEINQLSEHLQTHLKDHHSRRGLLMKVSKRNQHLAYLQRTNRPAYVSLIAKLGLRK